jgi:hypothetical protein
VRRALAALALFSAFSARLSAQPSGLAENRAPKAENSLQVYLVTIGEGAAYWEKFGHNALWFRDPARGIDIAYNWGVFDFGDPGYLGRVIVNDLRYWVEGVPGQNFINAYRQYDRTIEIQRLDLDPAQAQKAYDRAVWNARDENKYYRYDYFLDNCSTRVRDLIDFALGGALKRATGATHVGRSYRSETLRLVDDMKVTQFAINSALAQPTDRELTSWENMFVPSRVRDAIRELRVTDASGASVPVVAEERVLHQSQSHHDRLDAPRLPLPYLIAGLLLAVEFLGVGIAGLRSRAAEVAFRWEIGVWAFLTGLLGVVLLLGWAITEHTFWRYNENLLLLNPLSLFLMVLAPLSLWRPARTRAAAICAVIIAMLSAAGLILKGLPWFDQQNLAMIALLLPPHFAIAYGLWRRSRVQELP